MMIDPAFSRSSANSQSNNPATDGNIATAEAYQGNPTDARKEVYRIAQTLYNDKTDWVTFFREVLGTEGVVQRNFQEVDSRHEFETSDEYSEIQEMLVKLWQKNRGSKGEPEPTRVITVRMPESVHEALKKEAYDRMTSMNKLCISKLLQPIDAKFIPTEKKQR